MQAEQHVNHAIFLEAYDQQRLLKVLNDDDESQN